jgi:hypothetical protein
MIGKAERMRRKGHMDVPETLDPVFARGQSGVKFWIC